MKIQNGIDPERVRDVLKRVVDGGDYQSVLPGSSPWTEADESTTWVEQLLEWIFGFDIPGQILIVLLVAMGTVLLVLVGLWIHRTLEERRRRAEEDEEEGDDMTGVLRPFLEEARKFAGLGRFADAVHALLLSAQQEVIRRGRASFSVALTSREILDAASLAMSRPDLSALVVAVEMSRFGGAELRRDDYERCVAHHDRLLDAMRGSP